MGSSTATAGVVAGLATIIVLATSAVAHVQPSVNENNRYLKLGLLGDRVRFVYTVYLGERPGAQARRMLDRDHDGLVGPTEGDHYGQELADQVAAGLTLEVDGSRYPVTWSQVNVGLGTPTVTAGAFAVDMVTWICLAHPEQRGKHTIVLRDAFRLPQAGETEIYVEESPGVTMIRSTLGADAAHSQLKIAWRGSTGYLRDLGFHLDFEVGPEVSITADAICGAAPSPQAKRVATARGWKAGALAGVLAVMALVVWWRRRTSR